MTRVRQNTKHSSKYKRLSYITAWSEAKLRNFIREERYSKERILLENGKMNEENMAILANEFDKGIVDWREVSFWENNMGPRCAVHIDRILLKSTLVYLHLGNNRLGSEGVRRLRALENHKTLVVLDLWNNDLGDTGVEYLADVLPSTKLERLKLGTNNITDHGCQVLFASLPSTMKDLDLFSSQLTSASVNVIAQALLSTDPKLTNLNVGGENQISQVNREMLEEIAKVHKCILEW
ncbi:unnamed protein product [Rotaria sp. Silwood2]|nr:unnamed protein product [Rotaria sp. Silwood2]